MRHLFIAFILFLIGGATYLTIKNGVFLPVHLEMKNAGPFLLWGIDHIGPYHEVLPSLQKVEGLASQHGLDCKTTFGEYLDDPNIVEVARLRAFVGCVLTKEPAKISTSARLSERPVRRYVVGTFHGSPALGPYKAYGDAAEFMARRGLHMDGSVIEIYRIGDDGKMVTEYYFPIR